jgi:hypothetical protein
MLELSWKRGPSSHLVYLVYLVYLVSLVSLVCPVYWVNGSDKRRYLHKVPTSTAYQTKI